MCLESTIAQLILDPICPGDYTMSKISISFFGIKPIHSLCGPGWRSWYSGSLRADGPGIESRWGRDFPQPSRPALGPTQPPVQWVPGFFPGGKAAGAWG
jgi:hypothetical protein